MMKKKWWLVSIMCICFALSGCGTEKKQKSTDIQETYEQEVLVQESGIESEEFKTENIVEQGNVDNQEKTDKEVLLSKEDIIYTVEDYGEIQLYGSEFYYDENTKGFYYDLEMFFLGSDFLYTMNDTLQKFYDEYLWQYQETEEWYLEQEPEKVPEERVPYSKLLFLGIQHIDNDYVSLLFNDVTYMGGAHPYSMFDAITVDRHTGEEVTASEILGESNEEILGKVSVLMGLDVVANWGDIDFYMQDGSIIFFYRMPGYWEDVVLER